MVSKKSIVLVFLAIILTWMPLQAKNSEENMMLSPGKARTYSLLGTAAPIALGLLLVSTDANGESGAASLGALLFWFGGTFGPGTGYLYAHYPWGFWRGAIIRTVGLVGMAGAFAATWDNPDASGGTEIFIAGSVFYLGTMVYDIFNSAKSARDYNKDRGFSVKIKPCYIASKKAPGLMLSVGF